MAQKSVSVNIGPPEDAVPPLPKNVGHLTKESTEIVCPSCHQRNLTRVHKQIVTIAQFLVALVNSCCCKCVENGPITWEGRFDYNHYCSNCGCYIGRYMTLGWYKKRMFVSQRADAEEGHRRIIVEQQVEVNQAPSNSQTVPTNTPYAATTIPLKVQK